MNSRHFLPLLAALTLAGCDVSSTAQEGTSSETQTSLQALADSVSQLRFKQQNADFTARRQDPTVAPLGTVHVFSYGPQFAMIDYTTDSLFSNDSIFTVRSDEIINPEVSYYDLEINFNDSRRISVSGFGTSRSGFKFTYRSFDDSDRSRLNYQTTRILSEHQIYDDLLFRLGDRWETIIPGAETSSLEKLPIFEKNHQIGWLINPSFQAVESSGPAFVFSEGFANYQVTDMLGHSYLPLPLELTKNWIFDSLGVFIGSPYADSNGLDWIVAYRWKFLPGTSEIIRNSNNRATVFFKTKDAIYSNLVYDAEHPVEIEFPSDTGYGIARIRDGAKFISSASDRNFLFDWEVFEDSLTNRFVDIWVRYTDSLR